MSEVSELITKFDDPEILKGLLRELDVSPLVMNLIKEQAMCETFGWTPEQYGNTDVDKIDAFAAIMNGRQKAIHDKMPKPKN